MSRHTLTVSSAPYRGFVSFRFPYSDERVAALKVLPGNRYALEISKGTWLADEASVDWLKAQAKTLNLKYVDTRINGTDSVTLAADINPDLYPYQQSTAMRAVFDRSLMINFEMGLGKTACALESCRLSGSRKVLIVCPAIVRQVWIDEITKWLGGVPSTGVLKTAKDVDSDAVRFADFIVTSYNLMKGMVGWDFDAIIFDESHYLKNATSARSKQARQLVLNNPTAMVLALTGTPIADRAMDVVNQINTLWPGGQKKGGRFSGATKYAKYYHEWTQNQWNEYAIDVGPPREDRLSDLVERLSSVSVRVTKKEVAHLLPPFTTQTIRIDRPKKKLNDTDFEFFLNDLAVDKTKAAVTWTEDALEEATNVCVLTYLRKTAAVISKTLTSKGIANQLVDGAMAPEERHRVINIASKNKQVIVATMSSVGIGMDALASFNFALFAELSYRPHDMIQAMARFYRLSSKEPVSVSFLVAKGTYDESILAALKPKIKEIGQVVGAGVTEDQLADIDKSDETEAEFFKRMQSISADWSDDE